MNDPKLPPGHTWKTLAHETGDELALIVRGDEIVDANGVNRYQPTLEMVKADMAKRLHTARADAMKTLCLTAKQLGFLEGSGLSDDEIENLRNWLWQNDHHGISDASTTVGPGSVLLVAALRKLAEAFLGADPQGEEPEPDAQPPTDWKALCAHAEAMNEWTVRAGRGELVCDYAMSFVGPREAYDNHQLRVDAERERDDALSYAKDCRASEVAACEKRDELVAKLVVLTTTLRSVAIRDAKWTDDYDEGEVIFVGHRCGLCEYSWKTAPRNRIHGWVPERETHSPSCPLFTPEDDDG